jgi:hypothetical protein
MIMEQVSVFVENRPGRLVEMLQALRDHGINISALSVADTTDFGIVRMILSEPQRGAQALREAGFTARLTEVLKVEVPDQPGGLLDSVAEPLARAGINIEYVYAFIDPTPGRATVVIKTQDLEAAERAIRGG